jgi:hypothetical protein
MEVQVRIVVTLEGYWPEKELGGDGSIVHLCAGSIGDF